MPDSRKNNYSTIFTYEKVLKLELCQYFFKLHMQLGKFHMSPSEPSGKLNNKNFGFKHLH